MPGERERAGLQDGAHLVGDPRRGRLLDDLLVAPLDRTVAFTEVDDVAEGVAHDLDLDVTATFDERLQEDARVAERRLRLPGRRGDRVVQLAG